MKAIERQDCQKKGWRRFGRRGNRPQIAFFAALACEQRITILKLLRGGEKSTLEISPVLRVDSSVVSRHLAALEGTGLIRSRKDGVIKYYSVADERVFQILDTAGEIIKEAARQRLEAINNL